ncbi:MAG: InlB B-repeat-containing protein, partial [Coprobacter sp.]|nr:InlB B-repeat-containing protein [Coprobacter sp.]
GEVYTTETYDFGATVTAIAEPEKEGYTFSGWSEVPATMPANDVEVTGTFTKNVYTVLVSVNNPAYGSVSPETANIEHGETITLTATANLGYQFVGWFEGGRNISNEPNFSIIITSDKNYEATFEAIDKVNVTVVDENRTETKSTVYANVTVGNEKVWDVQANTISADKVSVSVDADGVASEVKIADGGQITTVLEVTRTIEKGKWALMSLPFAVDLANVTVDGAAAVNNSNIKVMVYDAAYRAANSIELFTKSGWKELTGTTIAANQGFAVAINANNGDEQKVTFTATSQIYDGTDKQISLSRYASTVNEGADADWNFYGNPTLAKAQKGTGYALYVYNAEDDSYDEYASSDVATYQPYAAWFVQSADDFNAMIFSAGVAGALAEADGVFGELQFSLNGDDEARIVLVDESSEEYVRNEDALYFPAINTNLSQLYLVKGNIKMAVSEQPSLTSMAMGYKAVKSGEQTLTLTSMPENTSVVLVDNVAGTETAMTLGDTYTFQSEAGTFNNRFVIETTDLTGISQAVADGEVKVLVSGTEINVYGAEAGTEVVAYTTNGTVVASAVAEEGVTTLSTSATGVIVVKVANTAVKVIK